jgi:predicted kinase
MPPTPTPTLHFFCGKPGAGKTTIANELARGHNTILLSEDVWMVRLFGDQMKTFDDYIHFSRKLKTVVGPLASQLLRAGNNVVMDFQANTTAGRAFFRSVFESANAAHVLHHVRASDRVCLDRIAQRNLELPEGAHHLTEDVFAQVAAYFEEPQETEGFYIMLHGAP